MKTATGKLTIVGWGLAGACVAWQLHRRDIPFNVIDKGSNHSTRTAAGIVNPIVFKRLTKGWLVDTLMPFAKNFYQEINDTLNQELFTPKKIYYPFTNKEDENNWSVRMGDERFFSYLEHTDRLTFDHVHAPHGYGQVNSIGYLNTNDFLDLSRNYFEQSGSSFESGEIDAANLTKANPDTQFIFCEGIDVMKNALFNYLPMKASHGEVLIIQSDELKINDIISKNLFVLPLGDNQFKLGSTYNWVLTEPITTDLGKSDLVERFENLVDCSYKIISHQAGVRPTVADRRPLLGVHPHQKNAFVFNGLGTKGVLLAPYFASHLLEFILGETELNSEVNIERFKKRFLKFHS